MNIQFPIKLHKLLKEEANKKGVSIPTLVVKKLAKMYDLKE